MIVIVVVIMVVVRATEQQDNSSTDYSNVLSANTISNYDGVLTKGDWA